MLDFVETLSLPFRPTDVKTFRVVKSCSSPSVSQLLFVTDYDKSSLRIYELATRKFLSSFKTPSIPYYVEVIETKSGDGCELIISCRNNTVHKYSIHNLEEQLLMMNNEKLQINHCWSIGSSKEKFGIDKFYFPRGIVVIQKLENYEIYICNSGNNRIDRVDENGTIIGSFGEKGEGNGKLDRPVGISVNRTNNDLFITDHNNGIIQVFNCEGQFKYQFGKKGMGNGELNCPRGILHVQDKVVLTDNHRVQILDETSGNLLHCIGSSTEKGNCNSRLALPEGICLDSETNQVLVADWDNKRIQFYQFK